MGEGLKRARAAAKATQLRWWTSGRDGLRWWLQREPGKDEPVGEVRYVMRGSENDGWDALVRGKTIDTYDSCRKAKLAVRRAVRHG